jgi:TctA family transporter
MLIFSGALVTNMDLYDIVAVVLFCILGLTMKHLDWPRPPMLLGYILGPLIEKFYFSSQMIFGYRWMLRPGVIVILILTALCLYVGVRVQRKEAEVQEAMEAES